MAHANEPVTLESVWGAPVRLIDPPTSHLAARAVGPGGKELREQIRRVVERNGPMCAEDNRCGGVCVDAGPVAPSDDHLGV